MTSVTQAFTRRFGRGFSVIILVASVVEGAIGGEPKINPTFSKVTSICGSPRKGAPHVYFFKQWHLAPGVDTKKFSGLHPQGKNLKALYDQLDAWIKAKAIKSVIAEGCEGKIDSKSNYRVNGWTVSDLVRAKDLSGFSAILTSVPLKLEAKYGAGVETDCGDTDALVKRQLLAFSDARGDSGYLSRMIQYADDPKKAKPYVDDVIGLLKLPKDSSREDAVSALKRDIKRAVAEIYETIDARNRHLLEVVSSSPEKNIAIVYGGAHAAGVKVLLERNGFACTIIEPLGYQNDEGLLLAELEAAMRDFGEK